MQKTQFSNVVFGRPFVELKEKKTFLFLNVEVTEAWYLALPLSTIFLLLLFQHIWIRCQIKRPGFEFVLLWHWFDMRSVNFFQSISLLHSKIKTSIWKKGAVETARSNRLSLRRIKIHHWRIRSKKCCLENWVFCIFFLENEAQNKRNRITWRCFSGQNKSVCQKLAWFCEK